MQRVGGSFAPPLTDELLAKYQLLIEAVSEKTQLREALNECMACCKKWWEIPESNGARVPHMSGKAMMTPLDVAHQETLWDYIPWEEEIVIIDQQFEKLHPVNQKELRNCAYHLLWHVRELNLDREPITADRI